ncbi:MAG: ATP-binding protein [Proteobacteria bacterium]|jgi:serine/threonine-protein kinase RsbW|nr:ATP-binding protein [Desulfobacterales bacterium]MBL6968585.1 ATP-binding protein [Desulfobacteraceae bacterium]MBL7171955.1 ATP-binding protein [Desulfobacteraceae bacterium]MBU0736302.1 ATP-binding protein [Pseudomonadota bacterium]MBU1904945.1 ATP-binding protein [Pseudomonadota bacterium]
MSKIRLPAKIEHLERIIEFVAGHAEGAGFPIGRIKEIELAAEEVLVNIFNYAYPGTTGDVMIDCSIKDDIRFVVEISDNGAPFDILAVPDPDVTADISDREIGGLGVFFVKQMADEARYRREAGRNVLTLIFNRQGAGVEKWGRPGNVEK